MLSGGNSCVAVSYFILPRGITVEAYIKVMTLSGESHSLNITGKVADWIVPNYELCVNHAT